VDQAKAKTFEEATNDFARFAEQQGYPARLLWITSADIVFWRGRCFVLLGDADTRRLQAKVRFEVGIARSVGMEFEGWCKADGWTICRVYVPDDDIDAQYRMILEPGVKMKVSVDFPPTRLVASRALFQLLKLWTKKTSPLSKGH
jgi:hypothetical protein